MWWGERKKAFHFSFQALRPLYRNNIVPLSFHVIVFVPPGVPIDCHITIRYLLVSLIFDQKYRGIRMATWKKIDRDDDIWKRSKRDKTRMPMQWWYGTTSIRPLNYCICHQFVLSTPLWKSLLGRMVCKWVSEWECPKGANTESEIPKTAQ